MRAPHARPSHHAPTHPTHTQRNGRGAAQIIIQLRKFNTSALKALEGRAAARAAAAAAGPAPGAADRRAAPRGRLDADLDSILGSSSGDKAEVDTSPAAIAKRVALLLLVGLGLGVGLFYLGLEYMFPKL